MNAQTEVGANLFLGFDGLGICIHKEAKLGSNVRIGQFVTIGGRSRHDRLPVIENDVYIGPGSIVLGAITLGEGCVVGASSLVIADVPPHSVVAGNPAKILRRNARQEDVI